LINTFILTILLIFNQINLVDLIDITKRGVVKIITPYSTGSGVIINIDGYIITNFHVIEEEFENINFNIKIQTFDDVYFEVEEIIDYDIDLDLAILKIHQINTYIALDIAEPLDISQGEKIIVIGSPFGIKDFITEGIVSKHTTPYLFISAPINPGNSGGAVINSNGELVGIPTMTLKDSQNLNFAMDTRTIRYLLDINNIEYNK